jgi:hypothetical protein
MRQKLLTNPFLMFIKRDVHALEYNASTQYRFNQAWAWFWFATMLIVPFVPVLRSSLAALLILEASLWANFATHFSGMSSALASKNSNEVKQATVEQTNG